MKLSEESEVPQEGKLLEEPEKGRSQLPFILSKEFHWVFVVCFVALVLGGAVLLYLGAKALHAAEFARGFLYLAGGTLAHLLALIVKQTRGYFLRLYERTISEIKSVELTKFKEEDFERVDEILELRRDKAKADFERNVADAFLLESFHLSGVAFFGEFEWKFKPGVNILLGRNGFGKSLIMRALVSLLQREEAFSGELFNDSGREGFAELIVQRNGSPERIRRTAGRFTESPGKIPVLAIPDSRFVNRADTVITARSSDSEEKLLDLRANGALHFLQSRPYGDMIEVFFNELCLDYFQYGASFKHPIFDLLRKTIRDLTDDQFEFDSVERIGRDQFRLLVLTEGNDRPLPIQYASQGTLSVLGVVGIIRAYLKAFSPKATDESFREKPAIVFVDELDAHLHPLWQQKLVGILRGTFPNIQFVLSAHSPLVVAGSWIGEVAVMSKSSSGLIIKQLQRDFLGTPVGEIYHEIFGVEDVSETYLKFASRATSGFTHQKRISELEKNQSPTELERRELPRLIREESMIMRAAEIKAERKDDQMQVLELEAKVAALEDQLKDADQRTV
jgi:hypothetical protein